MGQSKPLGKHRVLVVEDEPLLRMMAVDVVEEAGLEALEAPNADVALTLLEGSGNIHIIFTDEDMPGSMDGAQLAKIVRNRWPQIEIIVVSGHVQLCDVELPQRSCFFSKPYNTDLIAKKLIEFARNT